MMFPAFIPVRRELSYDEAQLLLHATSAHFRSARANQALSSVAAKLARQGNPTNPWAPIIGALSTLGEVHGPLARARDAWEMDDEAFTALRDSGVTVPGFGNHFFRESSDPEWNLWQLFLAENFPDAARKLVARSKMMREKRPHLFPNPAMFTAVTADVLEIPRGLEHLIVLYGRIPAWSLP